MKDRSRSFPFNLVQMLIGSERDIKSKVLECCAGKKDRDGKREEREAISCLVINIDVTGIRRDSFK